MSDENELKVLRTPKVYETVDEVLEANAKWKAEQIHKYKDQLIFLKESLEKVSDTYSEIIKKDDVSQDEIKSMNIKIRTLKSKIIKFEQMIADYESKPW